MKQRATIAALGIAWLLVLASCTPSPSTTASERGASSDLNSNYRTDGFADPRSR